jgi:hypothetical protein
MKKESFSGWLRDNMEGYPLELSREDLENIVGLSKTIPDFDIEDVFKRIIKAAKAGGAGAADTLTWTS